jgi:D-serine deaminase-like pyridoxal phosphate-dependent protein
LHAKIALSVVADHPDNVAALAAVEGLTVFVDVDPGNRRTGVASAEAAVALADAIASAGLRLGGVQYYCGSQQHIGSFAERRAVIAEKTDYLRAVLAALAAAGHAVPIVTGGGTGSFAIDAELGVLTELQVGSYIFMDREYSDCEFAEGLRFESALMVDATVVSANAEGLVTIDAGLKAFAADAGVPVVLAGVSGTSRYAFMGDEHGAIFGETLPGLGARVTLMPPHCDPTVNLYDRYWVVEGDMVVDAWPVTARGCVT